MKRLLLLRRWHIASLAVLAVLGLGTAVWAQAARPHIKFEAESRTSATGVTEINDTGASGGKAVQFSSGGSGFDPHQILPVGATLPDDATCRSRVTPTPEVRSRFTDLMAKNATAGTNKNIANDLRRRVSGAYTGTTDEILQWTACKWGVDADIVRAQAVQESWWTFGKGDWTNNPAACAPGHGLGVDGRPGQCPESYGILQVRYQYHGPPSNLNTWPEAETSTAYNADYTYAIWRDCYEGNLGWLNTVERGEQYVAGDAWGCLGVWFSGRWKTADANSYINNVRGHFNGKTWTHPDFLNASP